MSNNPQPVPPPRNSSNDTLSDEARARASAHNEEYRRSMKLLEEAREKAAPSYNSAHARRVMTEECQRRSGGEITPFPWQLDIAECLLLGVDTELIAATGAGKTIPFVLPLFLDPKKCIVVLSPLNALEKDQEKRFAAFGIKAKAVNGETWKSKRVRRNFKNGRYQIIITSPEMCIKHPEFRTILEKPKKKRKIAAFIIDEAHCIVQWGENFRTAYAELGALRAFVPARVPFLVTSATLNPHDLHDVRKSVHMVRHETFHLNLGNDRPNLYWEVRHMKAGISDTDALSFLVPEDKGPDAKLDRGIVFFDDIGDAMMAMRAFREQLPEHLRKRVRCYHARNGRKTKGRFMRQFNNGEIDILFATEAAGMGCDMKDVDFVVQFMVPKSLAIWFQRAGRAGRGRDSRGRVILLVQPTVFQEKGKTKRQPGDEIKYVKEIEDGLRSWIEADTCRRDVADVYFNNPVQRQVPVAGCCDVCARRAADAAANTAPMASTASNDQDMAPAEPLRPSTPVRARSDTVTTHTTPSKHPNENGKRPMREPDPVPDEPALGRAKHRDQQLADRREVLELWRKRTWREKYAERGAHFGIQGLMPDVVLTAFAANGRWHTVDDVKQSDDKSKARSWWALDYHGAEIFEELEAVDSRYRQAKRRKEEEKLARERAEAIRLAEERAEKERKEQEKQRQKEEKAAREARERAAKKAQKEAERLARARKNAGFEAAKMARARNREAKRAEEAAKRAERALSKQRLAQEKEEAERRAQMAAARELRGNAPIPLLPRPAQPIAGPALLPDVLGSGGLSYAPQAVSSPLSGPPRPAGSLAARPVVQPRPVIRPRQPTQHAPLTPTFNTIPAAGSLAARPIVAPRPVTRSRQPAQPGSLPAVNAGRSPSTPLTVATAPWTPATSQHSLWSYPTPAPTISNSPAPTTHIPTALSAVHPLANPSFISDATYSTPPYTPQNFQTPLAVGYQIRPLSDLYMQCPPSPSPAPRVTVPIHNPSSPNPFLDRGPFS
ncbi:unnamed protein product [Peniophora sp. CBMAI 1063]|nr:unnamed protein product [Peniophora sp. CBMAI 1063]